MALVFGAAQWLLALSWLLWLLELASHHFFALVWLSLSVLLHHFCCSVGVVGVAPSLVLLFWHCWCFCHHWCCCGLLCHCCFCHAVDDCRADVVVIVIGVVFWLRHLVFVVLMLVLLLLFVALLVLLLPHWWCCHCCCLLCCC